MSKTQIVLKGFRWGVASMGSGEQPAVKDKIFTVPTVWLDIAKVITPAIVALVLMYIKVEIMRDDLTKAEVKLQEMRKELDASNIAASASKHDIDLFKVMTKNTNDKISDSLQRISTDIATIQKDVKDIQKRAP